MEPKWSPGSIWREMGPGKQKKRPRAIGANPFWMSCLMFLTSFAMQIFKVFSEGLFFDPQATFERPRSPKESRKGDKIEAKANLEALSGSVKSMAGAVF